MMAENQRVSAIRKGERSCDAANTASWYLTPAICQGPTIWTSWFVATGGIHSARTIRRACRGVNEIVERQIELGVDIVNDGEYAKAGSYGGYMQERVSGYSSVPIDPKPAEARGHRRTRPPRFPRLLRVRPVVLRLRRSGPARLRDARDSAQYQPTSKARAAPARSGTPARRRSQSDIENLKAAIAGKDVEGYVAALGPLSLGAGVRNEHYASEEEYMMAVADACREEYKAITDAGLIVQVDEPEFCTSWMFYPGVDAWSEYRKYLGDKRRDHQPRAARHARRSRSASTPAGAAATARTSPTSSSSTSPT